MEEMDHPNRGHAGHGTRFPNDHLPGSSYALFGHGAMKQTMVQTFHRCHSTWSSSCDSSAGWWLTYPSEKYEIGIMIPKYSQYGKIKHVPNHQPANKFQ